MSGGFITTYRAEDAEKLKVRMKNGVGGFKFKPLEYERLQEVLEATRLESEIIGQKSKPKPRSRCTSSSLKDDVERTRCAAKATKQRSLLQQHRQVWSPECQRLQKAEENAENNFLGFLDQIILNSGTDSGIFSLPQYEMFLAQERESFKTATVDPIHQMKDDLKFRLVEIQQQKVSTSSSDWNPVIQQIMSVKEQQDEIVAQLHTEYLDLETEIMGLGLEKYLTNSSDNVTTAESFSKDILESDCPYQELKDSLIQAFHSLTQKYQNSLQRFEQHLQRTDRSCGWCQEDHDHFLFILSLYTHDIPNHRELCMDMLLRRFPEKNRQELNEHNRIWDSQRFTQAQLRAVTQQWQRDQEELWVRALVTIQEAKHAHQAKLEVHRDRQHQQNICFKLREKLQQWRAQQEEVATLEAAIAARQRQQQEARLKRGQEKETAFRSQQTQEVRKFHLKQQKRREELQHRDELRLAKLRSLMEEQARRDKQRVQFRADMLEQRRIQRDAEEAEHQREEQAREERLEALRNKVAVVAEADPERLMSETKSWRNQLSAKETELPRPLYNINTYTDTQIVSDPRVRVEQALREAGVQHSPYAREVLSIVQPVKPPRRDTKSLLQF